MKFQAVLFDMDGTLADNASFHEKAWRECLKEKYGYALLQGDPRVHGGKTPSILSAILGEEFNDASAKEFHQYKEARYRELAHDKIQAVAGLHEYLAELKNKNIAIALVTSADKTNTKFVLDALGLQDVFSVCVLGEDVQYGKPNPEPFLLAANLLKILPEHCLVHEDAIVGVWAAVAAGTTVAALATSQSKDSLLIEGATWAANDFAAWLDVVRREQLL